MVKNPHVLQQLEDREARTSPLDFERNLRLFEAMYQHACALGAWKQGPDTLPLKLRLAKVLNV